MTQYLGGNTMSSILNDIKHKIGPSEDYDYFDRDIIDAINAAFGVLNQLGVGPEEGFAISDNTTEWESFDTDATTLNLVKTYVYQRVKIVFDPPNSSYVLTSIEGQLRELEWRLCVHKDPKEEEE